MTGGVSRAGSQVMKSGRSGGRGETAGESDVREGLDGEGEAVEASDDEASGDSATRSIIAAILSNSSGQMSGQCVNPKYTYRAGSISHGPI